MNYYVRVFRDDGKTAIDEQIYEENMGAGFDFKAFKQMLLSLPKKRIKRKKEKEHPLLMGSASDGQQKGTG